MADFIYTCSTCVKARRCTLKTPMRDDPSRIIASLQAGDGFGSLAMLLQLPCARTHVTYLPVLDGVGRLRDPTPTMRRIATSVFIGRPA